MAANIPNLVYTPAADANGTGLASFTFQVRDNGGTASGGINLDASANTITFNVTPVADTVNDVLTINKNTPITFNPITGTNGASVDNFEGATPQITQVGGINITAGGAAVA